MVALSAADLERARQAAAAAPPLTPELRERLHAILAGCVPAKRDSGTGRPESESRP